MKENTWLNTRDNTSIATNTVLGSPRGWLQRAYGYGAGELFLHETSTDPREISVAGIWRQGQKLPDTGSWPAIYRRFRICDNIRRFNRAKESDLYSVWGMAVAVPADQVFAVYNQYRKTADWVWMDWPQPRRGTVSHRPMSELNHSEIYQLFEQGMTVRQVSEKLNLLSQSVNYVYKKWQSGADPDRKPRNTVDHNLVAEDLRMGRAVADIVKSYNISRTMVYKIKRNFDLK